VRAVRFEDFGGPGVLRTLQVDDPVCPAGHLLVRIAAAAVNHLDLDERAGTSGFAVHPAHQLGREGAGTVVEVGSGVDRGWRGVRVIVSAYPPCGMCAECTRGAINVCRFPRRPGIDVPGTYAEMMAVPENGLFRLPAEIPMATAACLQLGFGTAWHALIRRAALRPGQSVLVTGAGGGVGSAAVQVGALAGGRVFAVAGSTERRALAIKLGAEVAVADGPDLPDQVRALTGGVGVDVVLDAGAGPFLPTGLACLRTDGRYVIYGAHAGEKAELDVIGLFRSYASIIASRGWRLEDMRQVIDAATRGQIRVPLHGELSLDAAAEAHRAVGARIVNGKIVLLP